MTHLLFTEFWMAAARDPAIREELRNHQGMLGALSVPAPPDPAR